jgi:hypothetical protein
MKKRKRLPHNIKTLHELADFLLKLGEELKKIPDIQLVPPHEESKKVELKEGVGKIIDEIKERKRSKEEIEELVAKLTLNELIEVCKEIGIKAWPKIKEDLKRKIIDYYTFPERHKILFEHKGS